MTVSVLVSAYKQTYIVKAIESVFQQTSHDGELIVLDDVPERGIKQLLDPYLENLRYCLNPHIHYIAKLNEIRCWPGQRR